MGFTRELLLWGSENKWLENQAGRRSFMRKAVQRFMPGEDIDAAVDAVGALSEKGISRTILTQLGENVTEAAEADAVADHYRDVLGRIGEGGLDADISLKPTQLGIDLDFESVYARYKDLVQRADELGRLVAVDMESTAYADPTLELYRRLRADHSNVVLCLQAYLHRTKDDLASLLPLSPTIRLVKGAYKEPHDLAIRRKSDVDANFLELADTLLEAVGKGNGSRAFFGTHDPRMVVEVNKRAEAAGLPKDSYEFQMLYGIQRELQTRLAGDGYLMRVLISYGESWYPWYMRRLAERPANVWFLLKNIF
jgi:proline dehydrogenase